MSEFHQEYEISRSDIADLDEVVALSKGLHGGLDYLDYVFPFWVRAEKEAETGGGGRWRNLTLRASFMYLNVSPYARGSLSTCLARSVECIHM